MDIALGLSICFFIITLLLWVYQTFYHNRKSNLSFIVKGNEQIYTIKQPLDKLKIVYDGIDLQDTDNNISIINLKILNTGQTNIILTHYDTNTNFGFVVEGGKLISKPEIIDSSEIEYYSNAIQDVLDNSVILKPLIFDKNSFIEFKLLILHDVINKPHIKPQGKISGISNLLLIENSQNEIEQKVSTISKLLYTLLIFSTCFLFFSFYFFSLSISNNLSSTINSNSETNFTEISLEEIEKNSPNRIKISGHKSIGNFITNIYPIMTENGNCKISIKDFIDSNSIFAKDTLNFKVSFHPEYDIKELTLTCKNLTTNIAKIHIFYKGKLFISNGVGVYLTDPNNFCEDRKTKLN